MTYLVTGEFIDPGPMMPPQQLVPMIEHRIIPSFEALVKLEAEEKVVAGGVLVGKRTGAFIVEAASNEELNQLMHQLPFWGLLKWKVAPLHSFEGAAAQARQDLERMKQAMQ